MQAVLCLCEHVRQIPTTTRVCLLMHPMELHKTSNTGHLVRLALPNSESRVRDEPDVSDLFDGVVLFPGDGAIPLADVKRPVKLIVPDATWAQARRIARRKLPNLQRVTLPDGLVSEYGLRKRKREGGVCTLEAVIEALAILEGPQVREPLEHLFTVFTDRMLWARGKLRKEDVYGGIPHAALHQHGGVSSGYLAEWFRNRHA